MPLTDYFSADADKRARFIFNLIAPVYAWFDNSLVKGFDYSVGRVDREVGVEGKTVLDVGTGTGAWAEAFKLKGAKAVTGIDFSEKMLAESRKNHPGITFAEGNAEDLTGIPDNSFDIVTASLVLHGVKSDRRERMLKEMKRVTKKHVVIQDFSGRTPAFLHVLEWLERSDYRNFKRHFREEMKQHFSEIRVIQLKQGVGLYFGEKQ